MNRFLFSPRFLVAAALATAALGAASVAEARPQVFLSIGVDSGPAWIEPERGYLLPQPVYLPPRPVFVAPRPVFERPTFGRYDARVGWEREPAWRHREWRHREWRRHHQHEESRGRGPGRDEPGRPGGHWH